MRLAMDKAMELYIEFQNQFGGQLADAVPTEEFEALQACLSSADYDGAARGRAQHACTSSPRSSASSSRSRSSSTDGSRRRARPSSAPCKSTRLKARARSRAFSSLFSRPNHRATTIRARATRRAQGGHGYLEHARSGQDADRHGSRRARRRHVRRAREHARPAATARAPLLLSLREVRARGLVTRGLTARADRAPWLLALHYINVLTLYLTPDLPRGRRHRAVLLMVPAAARLGAAAILHRSGARRACSPPALPPFPKPIPYSPFPPESSPSNRLRRVPRTGFARDAQLADGTANRIQSPSVDERGQAFMRRGYKHHIALTLAGADERRVRARRRWSPRRPSHARVAVETRADPALAPARRAGRRGSRGRDHRRSQSPCDVRSHRRELLVQPPTGQILSLSLSRPPTSFSRIAPSSVTPRRCPARTVAHAPQDWVGRLRSGAVRAREPVQGAAQI